MAKLVSMLCLKGSEASVLCSNGVTGAIELNSNSSVHEKIAALHELLSDTGCLRGILVLGVDSRKIYFLETDLDRATIQSIDAIKFAIEPRVPVDAEDMAVLVTEAGSDQRTLVWDMKESKEVLSQLNAQFGVTFDAFVPSELIWLQFLENRNQGSPCKILNLNGHSTEQFQLAGDQLLAWEYSGTSRHDLCSEYKTVISDEQGINDSEIDGATVFGRRELLVKALSNAQKPENLRFNFSESLEAGITKNESPWQPVLLTCMVLLMAIAASLWFRSNQLLSESIQTESAATKVFRELYPNRRQKGAVDSQLETELKRQRLVNSLVSHTEISATILGDFSRFLKASSKIAPTKFQFDSIKIGADSIAVAGRVKSFDDFQVVKQKFIDEGFSIGGSSSYGDPFTLVMSKKREVDPSAIASTKAKIARNANETR